MEYEHLKHLKDGKYGTNNKYLNSIFEKIMESKGKSLQEVVEYPKMKEKLASCDDRINSYSKLLEDFTCVSKKYIHNGGRIQRNSQHIWNIAKSRRIGRVEREMDEKSVRFHEISVD